jgi:hypothetical protein
MIVFVLFGLVCAQVNLDYTSLLQTTSNEFDTFTATMDVSDESYEIECDCSNEGIVEIEEVKCSPSKIKLSQEREGTGSTYEEVSEKLENYENYTYAKVTRSSFRCLDGRITEAILGTPGGDAGEFVLGLLVYQDLAELELTQSLVNDYFESYLKCMDMTRFYMCTDQDALDHVTKELALDDLDIFNPDPSIQNKLLQALVEPKNIGDTHLRMLIQYPDLYSISPEAVQYLITAFYTIL